MLRGYCGCWALDDLNPISFIHDERVVYQTHYEIIHDAGRGGSFELERYHRRVQYVATGIWCNESQERYVLAVTDGIERFRYPERERVHLLLSGKASESEHFRG